MKTQKGAAMVEFAIIALLFFMILFGIIEFGRAFFTYNTLVEATRRGARVAAVCPADATGMLQVKQVTVFDPNTPDGSTTPITGLLGLSTDNVNVTYLKTDAQTPVTIVTPSDYDNIAFVRVAINSGFQQPLFIPGFSFMLGSKDANPIIVTTLPSESLGRVSPVNPPNRCCYGIGTCP
jgi:Flp pilus assembly protein TadG